MKRSCGSEVIVEVRAHRVPKGPPRASHVPRPIPAGLWVAEGVEEEPPESQWLVLPLPPGLPLADGGDGDDRDGELCWFMHWATAKPARQQYATRLIRRVLAGFAEGCCPHDELETL